MMSKSPGVEFYESRIIEEAIKLAEAVDFEVFTQAAEKMALEGFAQALISSAKTIRRCADAEELAREKTITVTREHEVYGRQEGKMVYLDRPAYMPQELFEEAVSEFSRQHPDLLYVIND